MVRVGGRIRHVSPTYPVSSRADERKNRLCQSSKSVADRSCRFRRRRGLVRRIRVSAALIAAGLQPSDSEAQTNQSQRLVDRGVL